MSTFTLYQGDCLDRLKDLEDNSIDSIVTDPPYGLAFMGKKWDYDVPSQEIWEECLRVLKPGGHLLSFAGSRTYHRMAVRIEDAGFEIRDQIMWVYGSGFPKSHNIGKAVDKQLGNEREVVGENPNVRKVESQKNTVFEGGFSEDKTITKGNSPWEGWGTALKPAHEPIVMARKPFKGSVAQNVLEWGTGGINIDGCRVEYENTQNPATNPKYRLEGGYKTPEKGQESKGNVSFSSSNNDINPSGRFPANIMFSHNEDCKLVGYSEETVIGGNKGKSGFANGYEKGDFTKEIKKIEKWECTDGCAVKILDSQSGTTKSTKRSSKNNKKTVGTNTYTPNEAIYNDNNTHGDEGGASRFFYCPKANAKDRNEGMPEPVPQFTARPRREDGTIIYKETHPEEWAEAMKGKPRSEKTSLGAAEEKLQKVSQVYAANQTTSKIGANPNKPTQARANIHPTVKPTTLMTYLIRLVTPPNGVVLDPFMGSGSTGKACMREGFQFVGIEREEEYMEIAQQRIEWEYKQQHPHDWF